MLMNARSGGAPRAGSYTSARGLHANAYHACPPVTLRLAKSGGAETVAVWEGREEPPAYPLPRERGGACRETTAPGWPPPHPKRVCCFPAPAPTMADAVSLPAPKP